jgi:hypothetical protein
MTGTPPSANLCAMKTIACLSLLLLAALPFSSCKSPSSEDVPCTCGTPMGDLEGCGHASCRDGKSNPDNPQCVCGNLEIPNPKK